MVRAQCNVLWKGSHRLFCFSRCKALHFSFNPLMPLWKQDGDPKERHVVDRPTGCLWHHELFLFFFPPPPPVVCLNNTSLVKKTLKENALCFEIFHLCRSAHEAKIATEPLMKARPEEPHSFLCAPSMFDRRNSMQYLTKQQYQWNVMSLQSHSIGQGLHSNCVLLTFQEHMIGLCKGQPHSC